MNPTIDFETMISNLDTALYRSIEAELNQEDRESLLATQKAVRERKHKYCYLEIGSHLGGSIQPHLLDPRCYKIYSIDKRPIIIPDDRGKPVEYPDNSTDRMIQLLTQVSGSGISKIECINSDARDIDPALIIERPDICFIDGEHTSQAVISDFNFCYSVIKDDGLICFHDSGIVWKGLDVIIRQLKERKANFKFVKLGGVVSVIGLNKSALHDSQDLKVLTSSRWKYFVFHQRVTRIQKNYFDYSFVNALKPGLKLAFNLLRKLSL
jgi:hypothetical protein